MLRSLPESQLKAQNKPSAAAPGPGNGETQNLDLGILPGLVGYQLKRAQVKVFDSFAEHLGRRDLTPGQFGVLVLIDANPGSTQTALAGVVGSSRSLMVRTLDRLEENGLVARQPAPADRRSHAVVVTAKGRRLVERLKREVADHERQMTASLSEAERDNLLRLLSRLNGDPHRST